jgi:NAD(P)-dependent dehydrogenase (short-subunit alcohol dehydrogenase family)
MRIIMTGATAGFGLFAAERLADAGATLTIGARNPAALPPSLAGRVAALALDLDALANVRTFAAALGEGPIDVLVLNAGLQLAKPATSADGFERTFAVNHLAHYLLLRLLASRLAAGARVILTGSGTHDPAEKSIVTPPRAMPKPIGWRSRIATQTPKRPRAMPASAPIPRPSCATS